MRSAGEGSRVLLDGTRLLGKRGTTAMAAVWGGVVEVLR